MSQLSESSELFVNCDEEVTVICKKLQQILTTIDIQEDKNFALKEAQSCIDSANENLKQMEVELQGYAKNIKDNLKQQFILQKRKLDEMNKVYTQMKSKYETQTSKELLFGKDYQRQKLLKEQEQLYDQNMKLQDAKMVIYGVEKEANDIQLNLRRQTDKLSNNIEKQQPIRDALSNSYALIKTMQNRIRNNKLVLFVVCGIILLAILIILFMHM
ncbi:unnamed protein product (macronuclear) [Paramecium tetraurelia]|uniref:Vesicle transport v-SNARE N-terminal domain-containing protein n=1 Tax=Paramecium tetraurelia TaxID=5888 RepID=A0C5I0_PARTE|nr:uncharacterized protein GSPATT00006546001 [Paramecium tetraurelia]CAK66047.1 unnamed protein product [Paramecium tetraurelia]|eukprot:XP_001433444.1 hypothetical protein (macronuclear) [Paramecium tetraurelia strain d4-2]